MAKKQQEEGVVQPAKGRKVEQVEIKKLRLQELEIALWGISPLIMHAWSKKAKDEMLAKQMKKAKTAKAAKDPEQDFKDSIYRDEFGLPVFPSVAFKASAVNAAVAMDFKKTNLRQSFHINGEMVPVLSDAEATMREDMVRIGMGIADIRYRGEFKRWGVILPVTVNAALLSPEQLYNLFEAAGFGVGIGEWRPERDGSYGMFKVADSEETAILRRWRMKRDSEVAKINKKKAA